MRRLIPRHGRGECGAVSRPRRVRRHSRAHLCSRDPSLAHAGSSCCCPPSQTGGPSPRAAWADWRCGAVRRCTRWPCASTTAAAAGAGRTPASAPPWRWRTSRGRWTTSTWRVRACVRGPVDPCQAEAVVREQLQPLPPAPLSLSTHRSHEHHFRPPHAHRRRRLLHVRARAAAAGGGGQPLRQHAPPRRAGRAHPPAAGRLQVAAAAAGAVRGVGGAADGGVSRGRWGRRGWKEVCAASASTVGASSRQSLHPLHPLHPLTHAAPAQLGVVRRHGGGALQRHRLPARDAGGGRVGPPDVGTAAREPR